MNDVFFKFDFVKCGCYYCLRKFNPEDIREYIDDGTTPLCPYCGIDSVILYRHKEEFAESIDEILDDMRSEKFEPIVDGEVFEYEDK